MNAFPPPHPLPIGASAERDFRQVFEELFRQYYRKLYFYAYNLVEEEETAKDVVNDVYCSVWEQRERFVEEGTVPLSFFYALTRNRCVDYLRHRHSEQNYREAAFMEPLIEWEPESFEEHEERLKRVMEAVEALSPQTRRVFEACFLENKSYKEVAAQYGISPNTVRNHIVMALKQLRSRNLVGLFLSVL